MELGHSKREELTLNLGQGCISIFVNIVIFFMHELARVLVRLFPWQILAVSGLLYWVLLFIFNFMQLVDRLIVPCSE